MPLKTALSLTYCKKIGIGFAASIPISIPDTDSKIRREEGASDKTAANFCHE